MGAAGIYVLANTINAAIPFFLLPILTRVLTPTDYGIVAMFAIVVSIMGALSGLSVHGAIGVRFFQLNEIQMSRYVGSCLLILAVTTVVLLALVYITRHWLEMITGVPGDWILVAVLVASAQFVINIRLSLWQVKRRPTVYGVFQVSQSGLNGSFSLVLVLIAGMAWQGRALGQTVAAILFMLLALTLLWRGREVARPINGEDARDAIGFGLPLVPHALGGLMIVTVDRLMISNMLDVAQTGIYMVGLQLGMVLGLVADAFNRAYAPWLMGSLGTPDVQRDRRIVQGTYLYFFVVALAALALAMLAPFLLVFLVGPEFQQAASVVIYITIGFALGGMYLMVTNYIFYASKTGYLAIITFAAGLLNFIATYFLIKANGLVGAAQGFMLAQAFMFFGAWFVAQRVHPMPWRAALLPKVQLESH